MKELAGKDSATSKREGADAHAMRQRNRNSTDSFCTMGLWDTSFRPGRLLDAVSITYVSGLAHLVVIIEKHGE